MSSINDVAKLAHVSKSTVSLVINRSGYVSEETRKKVEDAIEKLNYTPNRLAQGLSKKNSGQIAVVVPDVSHPYFSALVKSIEQQLARKEYMTIICSAKENEETERWYVEMLNRKIVDGIITAGHTIDMSAYKSSIGAIVSVDRYINEMIPIVMADHRQAAEMAAEMLIKAQCRRVAHFVGSSDIEVQSHSFNEKIDEIFHSKGVETVPFAIGYNSFNEDEYINSAKNLFDSGEIFDGVVGVDSSILACYREATARGISVPSELKLVSYDGTFITRLHTPVISSVIQPIGEIGKCAADLIVSQLAHKKLKKMKYVLPVSTQKGETC